MSISGWSWAFAEDVCHRPDGGGLENCTPLPPECKDPFPNASQECLDAAAQVFGAQRANFPGGGRSTVHADATHLIAQALGFSAADAYWVAAYDQATDLASFEARAESGEPVVGDGSLTTATVDGLERTNFRSGGVFFHFGAPRPTSGVDGLRPDADDPAVEPFLAHYRAWALAGSGASRPGCAAGITVRSTSSGDYATGGSCYVTSSGAKATVNGELAVTSDNALSFEVSTGAQLVSGNRTTERFDAIVGAANAPEARLGIYLHALADRVSHHVCLDVSSFTGPTNQGRSFAEDMSNADCAQRPHALRHMWETGVDFSQLPAEDRTTEAGLGAVYDELSAFAKARGLPGAPASGPNSKAELVGDLLAALAVENASVRVTAVHDEACARGLSPFPGTPPCSGTAASPLGTGPTPGGRSGGRCWHRRQ